MEQQQIRQFDLPSAAIINDSDTFTGTSGSNVGDDKKFSWSMIKNKLREIFAPLPNAVTSGCFMTVDENQVFITVGVVRIEGFPIFMGEFQQNFPSSTAGRQRFVYFFGQLDGSVIAVEGAEGVIAQPPAQPIASAYINHVLISDSGIATALPDVTGFALKSDLGEKINLVTTNKNNLVDAVNEVSSVANSLSSDQETLKIFKVSNYGSI